MTESPSSPSTIKGSPKRRSSRWKQPSTRLAIWVVLMIAMTGTTMNVSKMAGEVLFDLDDILEAAASNSNSTVALSSKTTTATTTTTTTAISLLNLVDEAIASPKTAAFEIGNISYSKTEKKATTKSAPRSSKNASKAAGSSKKKKSKQQSEQTNPENHTKEDNMRVALMERFTKTKGIQFVPVARHRQKESSNATKALKSRHNASATKLPLDTPTQMLATHDQHPLNHTQSSQEATDEPNTTTTMTQVSLDEKNHHSHDSYDDKNYSHYYTPLTTKNLWENSTLLPSWLKEYFQWHQQERRKLDSDPQYWQSGKVRFLIPTARKGIKSGGMTDRIRPLPAFLRLAAQSKRMLLLHWGRPCALEEFLMPPDGGMDWRVPGYMLHDVLKVGPYTGWGPLEKAASTDRRTILTTKYQSWNYGELWYKEQTPEGEATVYQAFKDMWRVVFTPSPPVAQRIQDNFGRMGLVPGEFATAHIRALYAVDDRPTEWIQAIARNAMNCVSNLRPGGPFFVASDSTLAVQTAINYGRQKNVTVVAANHPNEPLHVDFHNESDTTVTPAHFYDGFVDLYLMAATRCVAVGPGGFARWGHLLGYNDTCAIHHSGRKPQTCNWMEANNGSNAGDAGGSRPKPGYPSEEDRLLIQAEALNGQLPRYPMPML